MTGQGAVSAGRRTAAAAASRAWARDSGRRTSARAVGVSATRGPKPPKGRRPVSLGVPNRVHRWRWRCARPRPRTRGIGIVVRCASARWTTWGSLTRRGSVPKGRWQPRADAPRGPVVPRHARTTGCARVRAHQPDVRGVAGAAGHGDGRADRIGEERLEQFRHVDGCPPAGPFPPAAERPRGLGRPG